MTTLAMSLLAVQATQVIIPHTTFDSMARFHEDWSYNYPWGDVHNGAARMTRSHVEVSNGVLTLTAKKVTGQPPGKSGTRTVAINYISGTIYAKQHFNVAKGGGYDFASDVRATTAKGTWPAIWLTAVNSWPPEIDLAEWKGSGDVSFNTFNSASQVAVANMPYPDPERFHHVRAELRDTNGKDVAVKFYLDGRLITTQVGQGFVGKAFYLIIDLQMEGSSGGPGPVRDTIFQVRNLTAVSHNPYPNMAQSGEYPEVLARPESRSPRGAISHKSYPKASAVRGPRKYPIGRNRYPKVDHSEKVAHPKKVVHPKKATIPPRIKCKRRC